MKRRALLAAAITLASTTEADAQACLGRAAFSSGAVRTSIGYQSVNWYGGEIAVGSAQSGFGAARFETYQPGHSSSASTFSSTRMLVSGGTQVRVGRAQFCPIAGLGHANSESSFDSRRLESTVRRYEIGGAIGTSTGARDDVHVIPSLAIKYVLENGLAGERNQGFGLAPGLRAQPGPKPGDGENDIHRRIASHAKSQQS